MPEEKRRLAKKVKAQDLEGSLREEPGLGLYQ